MHLRRILASTSLFWIYCIWTWLFSKLTLILITYFMIPGRPKLSEIGEIHLSSGVSIAAFSSLLFVGLLITFFPLPPFRFRSQFVPSYFQGASLALGLAAVGLALGDFHYLGFLIGVNSALGLFGKLGSRLLVWILLILCEEFFFRQILLRRFTIVMPVWVGVALSAGLYALFKTFQMELFWMETLTLFLLAVLLSLRALLVGRYDNGAGFFLGLILTFQLLFGLPVLGSEFSGIFLLKFQEVTFGDTALISFLTGGHTGPLGSFAVQLVLAALLLRTVLIHKKALSNAAPRF